MLKKKVHIVISATLLLLILLIGGCTKRKFDNITNNPQRIRTQLKQTVNQKETVLVLISHKCDDCRRAQSIITAGVEVLRHKGKHVLVYDVADINHSDFKWIVNNIPGAEYKGGMEVPSILVLKSEKNMFNKQGRRYVVCKHVLHGGSNDQIRDFLRREAN